MSKKCGHTPLSEDEAKEILTKNGLNRTKVKIKLLQDLSNAHKPLSIAELHAGLDEACDVSTVFRTITQYKEKHMVHEVNLDEGFFRYEVVQDHHDHDHHDHHHHHHVRCRICGDIQSIEHCDLGPFEKAIAKLGFKDMEHRLEFTGVCSKCSRR